MDKALNDLNNFFIKKPKEQVSIVATGVLQGRLYKKGAKAAANFLLETTWTRRWFKEDSPGWLYYYEDSKFQKEKGKIELSQITQITLVTTPLFGFYLVTPTRTYILRAESHPERDEWVREISNRCSGALISDERKITGSPPTRNNSRALASPATPPAASAVEMPIETLPDDDKPDPEAAASFEVRVTPMRTPEEAPAPLMTDTFFVPPAEPVPDAPPQ